jgi:hypothetical protein
MRNFFFEDKDDPEYRDSYYEDEEENEANFMIPAQLEFMHIAQLDLVSVDLNQKLLFETIKMLEKGWLWRFYSLEKKLKLVKKTYAELTSLMEEVVNEESASE